MAKTYKKGDTVAVTIDGETFYEAKFLETIESPVTSYVVHKVKVILPTHDFSDYFMRLYPIDKVNYPSKMVEYMVSWSDFHGVDYCRLFKIKQTVNRPNNPDDYAIIKDWVKTNFDKEIQGSVLIDEFDETTIMEENYCVEI